MVKIPAGKVFKAVAKDNHYVGRQKVTDVDFENDEIVFSNNIPDYGREHYAMEDFVRQMRRHFDGIEEGSRVYWQDRHFLFVPTERSIPQNRKTIERANIRLEFKFFSMDEEDARDNGMSEPEEFKEKQKRVERYKPYFDLQVLMKIDRKDIPGYRQKDDNSAYWVIPDEQMKRIEYTMWRNNQFAKVFYFGDIKKRVNGREYEKSINGYMDGKLYTVDGRRIMLASGADPLNFTYSPAFAHVGNPSGEDTHACEITTKF